ncbi:MAG: heme o synthase, partial [Pirellulaceae bacterium]|nr:heme o synthase [Pirellulaceae bacterium]
LTEQVSTGRRSRVLDYVELTKPKIAALILVTVFAAGFVARWGHPNWLALLHAMIGTALVAASASALNQLLERKRDAQMARTADRPVVAGRISLSGVLAFAIVTVLAGLLYLAAFVNWLTVGWALLTWVMYVCVYTPLKMKSTANTGVGAIAGALPTLIGWSACGGAMDVRAAAIFLLVFLWQFPHFMAIAWIYRDQYKAAGFRMLTVADPSGRRAGVQAVLSALALLPVSFVPVLVAPTGGGALYLLVAFALGFGQLICAIRFCLRVDEHSARSLLRASLIYLPAVMAALMLTLAI